MTSAFELKSFLTCARHRLRKKTMAKLRPATVGDTAHLLEIYAPYVENTAITFEDEVPTVSEFEAVSIFRCP